MIETSSQTSAPDAQEALRSDLLPASPQQIYRRIALHGPLSDATRTEAKILIFISAFALAVRSPEGMSIVSVLSGSISLRPQAVPLTLMAAVFYFSSLLVIHTVSDVMLWWPEWRSARREDNTLSGGLVTTISALRLAVEFALPLVLALFAIR
jgi:hypothetical protein